MILFRPIADLIKHVLKDDNLLYEALSRLNGSAIDLTKFANELIVPPHPNQSIRMFHSVNQSLANNTDTPLTFNNYRYDMDNMYDWSVNTRLNIRTAGKYLIGASINWDVGVTGIRDLRLDLTPANGSPVTIVALRMAAVDNARQNLSCVYDFLRGDYIEAVARHTQGVALNVLTSANFSPEFWAHRLS